MKITSLETIYLPEYPSILFVAVHTDAGLTGYADTCYAPDAVAGYIHQFAAPMLLGHDPLAIELHWRRLYEVIAHTVGKGAELRGLSAIDVCLWDILGQAAGMPIWQVLGGGGTRSHPHLQHLRRARAMAAPRRAGPATARMAHRPRSTRTWPLSWSAPMNSLWSSWLKV